MRTYKDIDSYISSAPKQTQALLRQMRATIRKAAPEATEAISYGIPTFKLNGNLVHFGVFKDHVSLFPTSSGVAEFKKVLSKYRIAKGTIRFPLGKPLPVTLINKIVVFCVKESQAKKSLQKKAGKKATGGSRSHL